MRIRKVVNRRFDVDDDGVKIAGGINAVVAANVDEPGDSGDAREGEGEAAGPRTAATQRQRIVQRSTTRAGRRRSSGEPPIGA